MRPVFSKSFHFVDTNLYQKIGRASLPKRNNKMEKSGIYNIVKEYHPIKMQIKRLYCPCGTEMRYDRQITVDMPTTLNRLFYSPKSTNQYICPSCGNIITSDIDYPTHQMVILPIEE